MEIVDLTSNVCIDKKFTGKAEIQKIVSDSNCTYQRPKTNSSELNCEVISRCEYGVCCEIGADTIIDSPDYRIVSADYTRISSLSIFDYKDEQVLEKIHFLLVVNRFTRNLINYSVVRTMVKTIGKENFQGMIWLERLTLYNSLIETVPKETFQGLVRLTYIHLGKRIVV